MIIRWSQEGPIMQDQQQNTPGQIAPTEVAVAGQVGEDPAQPASISPWDLSSRSRNDVLTSADGDGRRRRNAFFAAAALVAVFGLGWAGGANWYRFSSIETSSTQPTRKVTYLRRLPDADAKSSARTDGSVRKAPATTGSLGTPVVAAPSRTASVPPREIMVAVPETRPTTIEGWTVREVRGATAILEGPDGVWTVTRGDTVPGIGRIDSIVRWGSLWIVATANGLIATP
jgi:hypothetical protein